MHLGAAHGCSSLNMDATNQEQTSVMKALRAPFSGVSGMFARRKEKAAERKQQKQVSLQAVEMLDFTSTTSSYHRKTHSDSSISTTDSQDGL
jgi:hypothetical protein